MRSKRVHAAHSSSVVVLTLSVWLFSEVMLVSTRDMFVTSIFISQSRKAYSSRPSSLPCLALCQSSISKCRTLLSTLPLCGAHPSGSGTYFNHGKQFSANCRAVIIGFCFPLLRFLICPSLCLQNAMRSLHAVLKLSTSHSRAISLTSIILAMNRPASLDLVSRKNRRRGFAGSCSLPLAPSLHRRVATSK